MALDRLRIFLFGEPRFEVDGAAYRLSAPPKALPMLAYLLLHRRGPVARETLAALLWPDADQASAYTNLRRHLHYLIKALPPANERAPWLLATKTSIAWNTRSPYWLDVEAFETEIAERHLRAHAVRLYSADLYERCADEWIEFERERLRTLQISNLAQLCADAQQRSSYVEALQYAQLMLAADPWKEDALRTIVETRMLLGDRAGAIAEYERFSARLREELGTQPLAETVQTYRRIAQTGERSAAHVQTATRAATMIGRRNELATLQAEWQRAARGEGRAAFIGGEAGIGKTTLLEALCEAVAASGGEILAGAASTHEDAGYGPFLAPAQAVDVDLATPAPTDDDRLRRFEALAAALEARAQLRPLLLAIEDLHWAGSAAFDLLRYLVLRLTGAPILFVATYREFEVHRTHPLQVLRRQLGSMRRCASVALSSLDRDDVRELASLRAGKSLDEQLVCRIYERSDGNPLFVSEIVRELRASGEERVPDSISEIVRDRLSRLSDGVRALLQTAAVAGGNLTAALLVRISGLREADVLRTVDEAIASHFLRQSGGDAFAFVHDVIREAVYETIPETSAGALHARVGFALRSLYENFSEIAATAARHFELGCIEDAAMDAYLAAAEHALEVCALDEAAAYARKALERAQAQPERLRALLVLESVSARCARRSEQRGYLQQLLAMSEDLSTAERAAVLLRHADFAAGGTPESQRDSLELLRAVLSDAPELTAAYLLRYGEYLSRVGEMREAGCVLREALDRLAAGDDPHALLRCLSALYVVALSTGDSLDEIAERANAVRARVQDGADAAVAARLAFIQAAAAIDRDPLRSIEISQTMFEHARSAGDVWMEALAHRSWGAGATRAMQLGAARVHLERCAEMTIAAGRMRDLARVRSWQVMLENRCANFEAAQRYGLDGIEAAKACGATDIRASIQSNLANTAFWAGDVAAAAARLDEALQLCEERNYTHPSMRSLLGEIRIAQGDLAGGIATIENAWETASPQDDALNTRRVHVPLLLGLAYVAGGQIEKARAHAELLLGERAALSAYYVHPQVYLWSAAQLLRTLQYTEHAAEFFDAARRRRIEVLETIADETSRRTFCAFVFNEFIERGISVEDPLHAWFTPYAARNVLTTP